MFWWCEYEDIYFLGDFMRKKYILKPKKYAHFDIPIPAKNMIKYVKSPNRITEHAFMPLIHFTRTDIKYSKGKGRNSKLRDLCYVSHKDAYVYQWYAHLLNKKYNNRVLRDGTNNCVIAYRNNKSGKFNAHFAKEVIDFIRQTKKCHIIIGDFTGFFDNLDHKHLKSMLCSLLCKTKLPDDYWAVFKNVTKYSWFELADLLEINGLKTHRELNGLNSALSLTQLHNLKSKYLKKNLHHYGIPQGTPISAVLSNIYMLDFDKKINDLITSKKGIYRRYSDDFIIVIPESEDINLLWDKINKIKDNTPRLKLQSLKTKLFYFNNSILENCNTKIFPDLKNSKNELEYLGFVFDGKFVYLRSKTISKYYYRAYHRVDSLILREKGIVNKKPDYYTLYKNYTHLGQKQNKNNRGNFLTYVEKCIKVFGMNEKVHLVKTRHWRKINNRIKNAL